MSPQLIFLKLLAQVNIGKNKTRGVQLSGGQDSTTLSWFTHQIGDSAHAVWFHFHFNHLWQLDNLYMAEQTSKISFWLNCPNVEILPTLQHSSETSARSWRHNMTTRIGYYAGLEIILQGHTQTDVLESALFNFLRGRQNTKVPLMQPSTVMFAPKKHDSLHYAFSGTAPKNRWPDLVTPEFQKTYYPQKL